MPLTNKPVNDYIRDNPTFSVLLYGSQGSGKTILAASAQQHPLLANLAFVDADPGLLSIVGEDSKDIHQIDFTQVKDLKDVAGYLKRALPDVKTVVFDTISALASIRLGELQGENEVSDWRHYMTLTGNLDRIVNSLRSAGYNIIMTAGVKDETVQVQGSSRMVRRRPDLSPELNRRLEHFADYIWHTYVSPDQSYNLLIRPMMPASGGVIDAKTRNETFNQLLKPLERPQIPGVIQIGKVGDDINKYPNMVTFFDLFSQAIKGS